MTVPDGMKYIALLHGAIMFLFRIIAALIPVFYWIGWIIGAPLFIWGVFIYRDVVYHGEHDSGLFPAFLFMYFGAMLFVSACILFAARRLIQWYAKRSRSIRNDGAA
jgi:hypothetical protein